jgi:uncharacterized protein (DUF362 family)
LSNYKQIVSIVKGKKNPSREEIHEIVFQAIKLIGGIKSIIHSGDKVLIKPNAGSRDSWRKGAVTCPYVVEAIAMKVKDAGAGEVIIGEASQVGTDTKEVFKLNGYPEIAKRIGAKLLDLNEDKSVKVEIDGRLLQSVRVFKTALESDVIISVPTIKTHIYAGLTLGLKNMKGLIPAGEKRRFHMLGLDSAIADLQLAIKPSLTVIDGILALGGLGAPVHIDEPVELDLIVAGVDPVAVDAVTSRVLGFDPHDIKHLLYAMEHGIGTIDDKDVKVRGEPIEQVRFDLTKPSFELRELAASKRVEVIDGGACSSCVGALYTTFKLLQETGELSLLPRITFVIGPSAEPPKKRDESILIIGNCLRKFRDLDSYIPGCPPLVLQIRDELRELIGLPRIGGPKEDFLKAAGLLEDRSMGRGITSEGR